MSLIVVTSPLRVSFLGGGSDYEEFFQTGNKGYTFGTTINLSVHLSALFHSRLSDYPYKLTYRITDSVSHYEDFKHPVAKHAFKLAKWENQGLHISTIADVPAGTGLGSSSSFTVGLLHLLEFMQGRNPNEKWLAENAVDIERKILKEPGGLQDQYFAAYGGTRLIEFSTEGIEVSAKLSSNCVTSLSNSLVLLPVGVARNSAKFAEITAKSSKVHTALVQEMANLAKDSFYKFASVDGDDSGVELLGSAMNSAWKLKKIISDNEHNSRIDTLISRGLNEGAFGAKLCGAGGSGFLLFIVEPANRERFIHKFQNEFAQEISISQKGSHSYNLEHL